MANLVDFLPTVIASAAGVAVLAVIFAGRRTGLRVLARSGHKGASTEGLGSLEGMVFGFYGLLIAFTFSGASSRYDSRRSLLAEEVNSIGTAYLRLDLLPQADRQPLQHMFGSYVDSRLAMFRSLSDRDAAQVEMTRSTDLQNAIWKHSVVATQSAGAHPDAAKLLLPALNDMIDITTTRALAMKSHPPPVVYGLLIAVALLCAFIAGYEMADRRKMSGIHIAAFVAVSSISLFVILDLEYPRIGLIRLDPFDTQMVELRATMP